MKTNITESFFNHTPLVVDCIVVVRRGDDEEVIGHGHGSTAEIARANAYQQLAYNLVAKVTIE